MARLWEDQPDYYDTSTIETPGWTVTGPAGSITVSASGGRRAGTNAIRVNCNDFGASGIISKTLAPGDNKIVLAFGMVLESWNVAVSDLLRIGDATVTHLRLVQNIDGTLEWFRGSTSLGSTGFAPTIGTFYHYSLEAVIDDSVGTLSFKVNKIEKMNGGAGFTGIDTQNGGSAGWSRFQYVCNTIAQGNPAAVFRFCDVVVNDGTGGSDDTHPGDCAVYVDLPNANGGVRDFTPSTGTDDFAVVDEVPSNDGTDYIASTAVNQRTTVAYPSLSATGVVKSVTFRHRLALDAAGTGQAVGVMRKGGTNYDGSDVLSPTTAYDYFDDRRTIDPATSAAFTISDVNAIEGGIKRSV